MYMFHGVSGRGRHLENVLPVTAWKNGWYSSGFDYPVKTAGYRRLPAGGAAFVASNYIRQLVTLSLSYYVDYYWQIAGMILTAISLILVMKTDSHRSLHDYFAKTRVTCVEKTEKRAFFYLINKEHVTTCNISQGGQY